MAETVSIEEELARRGRCFQQTRGVSMEPLLHQHYSTVVLEPLKKAPRKDDVVLYRRPDGEYVLHRVLRVEKRAYIFRGDNCLKPERVPGQWLVGVMTGFYNGDVYTSCEDEQYREYVKRLNATYWLRWCRAFPGRAMRKLKGWLS